MVGIDPLISGDNVAQLKGAQQRGCLTVCTVVGARPQFIKAAAMSRALARCNVREARVLQVIVHSGQHFDPKMSADIFEELGLQTPDVNLGVAGGDPTEVVGSLLPALRKEFDRLRPDVVLVFGDTSTTLAGALAAFYAGIPVCHVEAGVRSFNSAMPEEVHRVVSDRIAALLCCPTATAVGNLAAEGITRGVLLTGDVMRDQFDEVADRLDPTGIQRRAGLADGRGYFVLTLHRAENTNDPQTLRALLNYVLKTAGDLPVIFPVHPRTFKVAAMAEVSLSAFHKLEPLGYRDMVSLVKGAKTVFTDSGGLQKEAYFLGVPCVTLRNETEWPETVDAGWNRLWRTESYKPRRPIEDLDRTGAADRIARALLDLVYS